MAYTKEQIQALFQSQFNVSTWTDFIINFFKAQTLMRVPEPLDINSDEGTGYYWGKLSTKDTYEISFFYLKMNNSIDRRKVGLRQLIEKYIKIDSDAGIAVFDDGNHWRLSFITDMRGEKTSPKRFTFVFGDPENHYLTPVTRFLELQKKGISYTNIREAFSVEALTKQFYNDLFDWYTWALNPSSGVYFPNNPNTPEDDRDKLDTKMIRLITRLMFVWFIKQKELVPDDLFNPERLKHILIDFDPQSMDSSNYYQAILQNLFFATLNRPIKTVTYDKDGNEHVERRCFATNKDKPDVKSKYRYQELFKISEDKILSLFEFIPFINGGLFECLDKNKTSDGVEHAYFHDGFSRNDTIVAGHYTKRAFIPNKLFFDPNDGIIEIFRRYNFTVEENSPSEQLVALDPELLGKVFENLLGVYNPETHDTARNQSGSFYTPREIVNYMVDISLQAYLGNSDKVKALFTDDFEYDDTKKAFYDEVIAKLNTIKVLDPACGSGAFPMGMLNRIVEILQNLQASGSKYDMKLAIMENCIFGGDIQTIAAQITKLRFFISLVCDCEKNNNPDDNFGIPNLPNLETHFVTADSLIALRRPQQQNLFEQDVIELQKKLQQVRHEHFIAKTVYQKTKLRNRDKELRDELIEMLKSDNVIASENAYQMAKWNPYDQNGQSPFFDPKWMFGIEDGFDLIIGNPPYRRLQDNAGELANKYATCGFDTFDRNGDIYCLFYERGWQLLKKDGHLCFITSNKWMRAGYGEKVRGFFSKKVNPMLLIDFAGVKIFESATVDTNILLFAKANNKHHTICAVTNKQNKDGVSNLSNFVQQQNCICDFYSSDSWVILSPIEQSIKRKIEAVGTPLKDWDIQINYGIKTGFNDAFIISTEKRNEILANCRDAEERKRTEELLRPILRGRDIKRYGYDWANLWIIATFPSRHYDIDRYPAVKQYLLSFGIERLEQTGKTHIVDGEKVKARKKTNNKWFETQDSISYWEDFSRPKIIWKRIGSILRFSFDNKGCLGLDSTCFATGEHIEFLCCVLNSLMGHYLLKDSPKTGTGDLLVSVQAIEPACIPYNAKYERQLLPLLEKQIANLSATTEKEINDIVFTMYGLSPIECDYVTRYIKLSQQSQ
jgi:type I restriction-modification system DNA methylase subunit